MTSSTDVQQHDAASSPIAGKAGRPYDGGPAFPAQWWNNGDLNAIAPDGSVVPPDSGINLPGMSLRDYFAAQAMQALLAASNDAESRKYMLSIGPEKSRERIAEAAYAQADAMLKARA